jgi:hypothetical protein
MEDKKRIRSMWWSRWSNRRSWRETQVVLEKLEKEQLKQGESRKRKKNILMDKCKIKPDNIRI